MLDRVSGERDILTGADHVRESEGRVAEYSVIEPACDLHRGIRMLKIIEGPAECRVSLMFLFYFNLGSK